MKWTVYIRAGVCHHIDAADMEFRPFGIKPSRRFAAQKIANERCRQPAVRHHSVLYRVAQIKEVHLRRRFRTIKLFGQEETIWVWQIIGEWRAGDESKLTIKMMRRMEVSHRSCFET